VRRKAEREIVPPLDDLAGRVRDVYLHVDFDAFAPEIAPGIVDEPVPGGLSLEDAERIISATAERFRIQAATLATYVPEDDHDDKTLGVALHVVGLLGDYASNRPSGPREGRGRWSGPSLGQGQSSGWK